MIIQSTRQFLSIRVLLLLFFFVSGRDAILLAQQTFTNFQNASVVIGQSNFNQVSFSCTQSGLAGPSYVAVSAKGVLAVAELFGNRVKLWNNAVAANGTPADVVVGKPNFTTCSFSAPTRSSMVFCSGVAFTPDGNKLIVADAFNNRVLIWNTIPTTNGQDPDIVLGQVDFTSKVTGTSATNLSNPTGIYVSNCNKLFVTDRSNHRVLIWNNIPTASNTPADIVVGQPDFTTSTIGNTANKMNEPWGVWVSNEGQLLVADVVNHRVLVFNQIPAANGAAADVVIGQSDFGMAVSGTTDAIFSRPVGVTVDANGRLVIGEFLNRRVLIYNSIPTVNGAAANVVLGQPNFTQNATYAPDSTAAANNFAGIYNTTFDLNGRLIVTGSDMNRTLIFGVLPTTEADLAISLISSGEVCLNESTNMTVSVTNNGPSDATGVVAAAMFPSGFTYSSHTLSTGSYIASSGYWTIGDLPAGATVTLTVQAVATNLGSYPVYSSIIQSNMLDNQMGNNSSSSQLTVIPQGDIKTVGPASASPSLCINTLLPTITHLTTVATGIGNASGLPAGVSASWSNDSLYISGTPTESGTFSYTIPLTGGCGNAEATGSITVFDVLDAGTIHSTGDSICLGGTPSLISSTTAASGGDGAITYSWRSSADNYATAIPGATGATYTPPSGLNSTTSYQRYAQDGTCKTTATLSSGSWTVTVRPAFNSGTIASTGETICSGGSPGLIGSTTAASGGDGVITYSWRSSADNYVMAIPGATGATYTPPSGLTSTTSYQRYAQDGTCNTTATLSGGSWTVTVLPPFSSGTIASTGETICSGGSPGLIGSTTAASGGDGMITYSWRSSADNYATAIPDAVEATYTPPLGLTDTTTYRRYAQDGTCSTTATAASGNWTVTVLTDFSSGTIASIGDTICYGGSPALIGSTTAASGGDDAIIYSWRSSADDYATAIPGAAEATFTPPSGLTGTTTYRRYAQDGTCNTTPTVSTGSWTVTVRPVFNSGAIAISGQAICFGDVPVLIGSTADASGGDGVITYSWRSSADNYAMAIIGATGATYTPPSGLTGTTTYRRYAQDGLCNNSPVESTGEWTVEVRSQPVIVCPTNLLINTSADGLGDCKGTATWVHPDFPNDACLPASLQLSFNGSTSVAVQPGATQTQVLDVGMYTLLYAYLDSGSNPAQCSLQITVLDDELPNLNCFSDTSVVFDGQATLDLNLDILSTVSDNCVLASTSFMPNIVSVAQVGQSIPVQVTATDEAGNTAACITVVRVSGLPAGWATPPNSGTGSSSIEFNPATGVWNGTSTGFTTGSPYTQDRPMLAARQLCGNGSITVLVSGLQGVPSFAGIAMRESNAANAKKVQMMLNGTSNFLRREIRYETGGQAYPSDVMNPSSRSWLRIERTGNVFRGYTSANGENWWFVMQVVVPMNSCIDVGLVLINMQSNFAGNVTFEQVVVTGADSGPTISAPTTYLDREDEAILDAVVYPNPGTGIVHIDLLQYIGRPVELSVFDNQGRFISSRKLEKCSGETEILDLMDKPSGVYTLRISTPGFPEITKLVVIR